MQSVYCQVPLSRLVYRQALYPLNSTIDDCFQEDHPASGWLHTYEAGVAYYNATRLKFPVLNAWLQYTVHAIFYLDTTKLSPSSSCVYQPRQRIIALQSGHDHPVWIDLFQSSGNCNGNL